MSSTSRRTADSVSLPSPKERRRLREALGLREEDVADAVGVTRATVRNWETGRTEPRGRKREAYAKLLTAPEPTPAPPNTSAPPAPAAARTTSVSRPEAAAEPAPHKPGRPAAAPAASSASTRPKAAAKRAAKPPRTPAPAGLGIGSGRRPARPARAGAPAIRHLQERQKPLETLLAPEPPAPPAPGPGPDPAEPTLTPEEAFDALYAHAAPGLVHQTYLLTGRRRLSKESVERAFHQAWENWPEVAVDRDPVGWVRAAAYEYALSPWHRFRRAHKHPDAPPAEAGRRALLAALLELPPPYRRTVLLYDGLGLDLPETAAETEASTPAAANRVLHARTVIGQRVPELADPDALHERLGALATEAPPTTIAEAESVRSGSERRSRLWTRAVVGVTAALIGVTAFTAATAPTQYLPVNHPGETVNGVPVRGGSQKLTSEDKQLRDKLRSQPHHGPERLIPQPE